MYSREGKAITNFHLTLPKKQGNLAQALTRDPYNFNFLTLDKPSESIDAIYEDGATNERHWSSSEHDVRPAIWVKLEK